MDIVVRIAVVWFTVLVGLRLLGKREFGQLSPIELVTLLTIPEVASQALNRGDPSLTNAVVGIATLLVISFMYSLLVHKSPLLQKLFNDSATVLVAHGKLREDDLNRERVTPDEIFNEMHKVGLERLDQVRWAILESEGQIAIVPEPGHAVTRRAAQDKKAGPG